MAQVDLALAAELRKEMTAPGHKSAYHASRTLVPSIKSFCIDQDVNRALASLLLTPAEAAAMLDPQGEEVITLMIMVVRLPPGLSYAD